MEREILKAVQQPQQNPENDSPKYRY
jgi:hypothetical protein